MGTTSLYIKARSKKKEMMTTDIEKVRELAIDFANLPVKRNPEIPFLVCHPFLDVSVTLIPTANGREMVNVLEGDGEEKFREYMVGWLKRTDSPMRFFMMLRKPYRFTFLNHVQSYLSDDDLGKCLRSVWSNNEHTNSGSVFTKKELVSLFSRSTKNFLMDNEELSVFQELPDRITIYRGTSSMNSKDLKVFSWTLSQERAEWYAGRFDDEVQNVFQAELPKDGAFAYFSVDKEIIANPYKLENIRQIS